MPCIAWLKGGLGCCYIAPQGLDPPMLDAPWPSGFGPPAQRQAPLIEMPPAAEVDVAETVAVEAEVDVLPGGTVRLGGSNKPTIIA
jgi:hypothetical protein